MHREYRYIDYINIHRRFDCVVLHGTWENFYSRIPIMTCGSLIWGQIKKVAVHIKGKHSIGPLKKLRKWKKNIQGL